MTDQNNLKSIWDSIKKVLTGKTATPTTTTAPKYAQDAAKEAMKEKLAARRTHILTSEETLSHLSLKYYGHATREYWMVIYEANKAAIGDNPAHVRTGMKLIIPELPAYLKAKK